VSDRSQGGKCPCLPCTAGAGKTGLDWRAA
jgi:hypothetical protein